MKALAGLRIRQRIVERLGCIKGCLEYLGSDVSFPWLYGGTGHAFVINVHEVVCPSGPTAWNTERCIKLACNVGCGLERIFSHKQRPDFGQMQKLAWEKARRAIDEGMPCCGWELEIPEYYVIRGYDDVGYFYSGPRADEGGGPKPWVELGDTGIGVLEHQIAGYTPMSEEESGEAVLVTPDRPLEPDAVIARLASMTSTGESGWKQGRE